MMEIKSQRPNKMEIKNIKKIHICTVLQAADLKVTDPQNANW